MCQGTRLDLSRLSSYEQTKKHFASSWRPSQTWMTILFGYPKTSRDFIFARASQIWAIQSIKHSTFDVKFSAGSAFCGMNAKVDIKSWVLDWLNGSNPRCSSEDEISWTFCRAKQYCHSCLGKPSTRCKMLFRLLVARQPRQIDSLVPWHIHV